MGIKGQKTWCCFSKQSHGKDRKKAVENRKHENRTIQKGGRDGNTAERCMRINRE